MQSVIRCTHYIAGAGEMKYLNQAEAPGVTFVLATSSTIRPRLCPRRIVTRPAASASPATRSLAAAASWPVRWPWNWRGAVTKFICSATPVRSGWMCRAPRVHFHEVQVGRTDVFRHREYALPLAAKMAEVTRREKLELLHVHYAVPHAMAACLAAEMIGARRAPHCHHAAWDGHHVDGRRPQLSRDD